LGEFFEKSDEGEDDFIEEEVVEVEEVDLGDDPLDEEEAHENGNKFYFFIFFI
jgi:hypothetical protein